jgi:hypothetical protein
MMMKFALSLLFALFCSLTPVLAQDNAPDALVRKVTDDVLTVVRQDKEIRSGNTRKAIDLVETKVLPYFNFQRMTALAVGRDWNKATPEQKTRLAEEFKTLLVRTYANALTSYKDQRIVYKPTKVATRRQQCRRPDRGRAARQPGGPARLRAGEAGRRLAGVRRAGGRCQPGHQLPRHLQRRKSAATASTV